MVTGGAVRTVLGDLSRHGLGRVDYHEHLFQMSPLLPGEDLDDEGASGGEAAALVASGFDTMVDATPTALGRRPAALARIARSRGLGVIATTGAHRAAHYGSSHWLTELTVDELAARFLTDVRDGLAVHDAAAAQPAAVTPDGAPVRAGLLKAGIEYWAIGAFEQRVLAAVGIVHRDTGAPVMVHLEFGSAAFEVLEVLAGHGVPADAVALAHIDRNPDPGLHAELAAAGAYLGYDGMARSKSWPDATLLTCLLDTAARGGGSRILLGGDVARRSRYRAYGGLPGLEYLGRRFLPRLAHEGSQDLVDDVTVRNPSRWLGRFPDTSGVSPDTHG